MSSSLRIGRVVSGVLVVMVVVFAGVAQDRAHAAGPQVSNKAPTGACGKVVAAARAVLTADDARLNATTDKASNAAIDRVDAAIDKLRVPLHQCDPSALDEACAGVVSTAQQVVATEDQFDRAETDEAETVALNQQDPAIAELSVRLADCRSGAVPEPCKASMSAARKILVYEDKFQLAKNDKAENAALTSQDRAIAELKVRLAACRAAPAPDACTGALDAGQKVVDVEDQYHLSLTEAEGEAALDAEAEAIAALSEAVASCGT